MNYLDDWREGDYRTTITFTDVGSDGGPYAILKHMVDFGFEFRTEHLTVTGLLVRVSDIAVTVRYGYYGRERELSIPFRDLREVIYQ